MKFSVKEWVNDVTAVELAETAPGVSRFRADVRFHVAG
jgi:hypothetical protein